MSNISDQFFLFSGIHHNGFIRVCCRLWELIINQACIITLTIDNNFFWKPLQISFLKTEWKKNRCFGKCYSAVKRFPATYMRWSTASRETIFFNKSYLSSSFHCLLHCPTLFRCSFVSIRLHLREMHTDSSCIEMPFQNDDTVDRARQEHCCLMDLTAGWRGFTLGGFKLGV